MLSAGLKQLGAVRRAMSCEPSSSVTVSVLSIEGTDCRLDELGRLADRTGGKVRPLLALEHPLQSGCLDALMTRPLPRPSGADRQPPGPALGV